MSTIIQFRDINVKEALLASSDINPDGTREITYEEAKSSSITGAILKAVLNPSENNTDIVSFEEFQYFTGIDAIPNNFLKGCSYLKAIKFPINLTQGKIGSNTLSGTAVEKLDLSNVTIIYGNDILGNVSFLKEVWVPNLTAINGIPFKKSNNPSIEKVVISSINQWETITIHTGDSTNPNALPTVSGKTSLYIGDTDPSHKVTRITTTQSSLAHHLYDGIQGLEQITIGENNTIVGDYTFANLNYNNNLVITNYNKIVNVGVGAFYNTIMIGIGNIPTAVQEIQNLAYSNSNLYEAKSSYTQYIGGASFSGSTVEEVVLNGCTQIRDTSGSFTKGPFSGCKSLRTLEMTALTTAYHYMCSSCTALTTVTMTALTKVDSGAFSGCTTLTSFYASSLSDVRFRAFLNCSNLDTIDFDISTMTYIDAEAFMGCSKIHMPYEFTNITKIGDNSFNGCIAPSQGYVYLNTSQMVEYIPNTSFSQYSSKTFANIKTIYVPDTLVSTYLADTKWQNFMNTDSSIQILSDTLRPT